MSEFRELAEKTVVELFDMLKAKVAEIEQLKAEKKELERERQQVQDRFNFLLDKNICDESEHATLKLKFMEITRLAQSLRNEFDLNSDCSQVERQIELLEKALRGEHE
ncbi:hypothetical protein [Acinetobacter amyesii]|uniref:hypothetical protein n=1 Tax=Acinetobacter amyesii TaxID=2942470 RepID=UPI003F0C9D6A